jgi:hypothetical protein
MDRMGGPESLAEAIAQGRGECPIPATHDRVRECHYWWHEMARNYHEPNEFRWSLGAFLQAARSVTFMLQTEKGSFRDFDWYTDWQTKARQQPLLRWVNDTRVQVVHQAVLAANSWARFTCLFKRSDPRRRDPDDWDDSPGGPLEVILNPFVCTHQYLTMGFAEDHPHEYIRHWEIDSLKDRELLDACASIIDLLIDLSSEAHARAGAEAWMERGGLALRESGDHVFPCMNNTVKHRTARTAVKNGVEVWKNAPAGLHSSEPRSRAHPFAEIEPVRPMSAT